MFKNGFTTIGENFVNLVGIGAVVFVVMLLMSDGDAVSNSVTYAVELMQWFFLRIVGAILIALSLVLGTIYAVAEVFSRRDYKPIPPKHVAYRGGDAGSKLLSDDIPIVDAMRLDIQDNDYIEADSWKEIK